MRNKENDITRRLIKELRRSSGREILGHVESAFYNHREIDSVDKFMAMEFSDFKELEGVGEKTAQALVDIQTRIKQRNARHIVRDRTYDVRHRSLTEDIRVLRTSPLTRRIELLIGRSIAGTTDEIINSFGFVDVGRFLLITSDWLAARNVSVIERNNIRDIQEALRFRLLKKHSMIYYSDNFVPLLLVEDKSQVGSRILTTTSELDPKEIYVVDRDKCEVSRIEHQLFFVDGKKDIDASVLNAIAEYYKCIVCKKTLAMVVGRDVLNRAIS